MAFAAPLAAIASAGGALVQGAATANAADYQAEVASNNAITAGYNAAYATRAGEVKAEQQSRKGAEKQAAVKAAMSSNGVDVNSGSAVNVESGERELAQTDTENVRHDSLLQAYGYRTQQTGFEAQAGLDKQTAETAPIGAALTAGGDLLSQAKGIGGIASSGASSIATLFSGNFGLPTGPYPY